MKKNIFNRTLELLSPEQRAKGLGVIFLLIISSLLDFFSLASLFPLILIVVNPQLTHRFPILNEAAQFLGITSPGGLGIALTMFVILFIVLKTRINQFIAYRKAYYAFHVANDMASAAVARYLKLSYQEFTHADFSKVLDRLSNIPLKFANNIMIPSGTLISEALVFVILCTAIAFYKITAFALLFLILIPALFMYRLRRKQASQISAGIAVVYPKFLKHTLQIVEGLIEIRSFNKEAFFKKQFDKSIKDVGDIFSLDHASQTETSRTTELIAAVCVCMMIAYSLVSNQNREETLLLLSVYAGVSFRLVPSINRIFLALHQIRVNEHVIDQLSGMAGPEKDLEIQRTPLNFHTTIFMSNISFAYPDNNRIFHGANLEIRKGEKIAIMGTSGEGKTTLFLILMKLLHPQEGEIILDGKPLRENHPGSWLQLFGYVPQQPYLLDGSIAENIAFGIHASEINEKKINTLLVQMDLLSWVNSLPNGIHTVVGEKGAKISGGQRQRLAIARGVYHDCEILLLDEVTNQLDPVTESEIFESLQKVAAGKTILMITHHPELLRKFDHVYEVAEGAIRRTTRHS